MAEHVPERIELIPIDRVSVINPRVRNRRSFQEIVDSIATLGLKRPITVAQRECEKPPEYDLVCGQGRLEAFRELGRIEIPAIVIEASREDCLVMSLVENLARRQHHALDLLRDIGGLKTRGYTDRDIVRKTGLSNTYVRGVLRLLEGKEHRLLRAAESGKIPVSIAVAIAEAKDTEVQDVLRRAYEENLLRGNRLIAARRLVEARMRHGKGAPTQDQNRKASTSVETLMRTYREDVERKRDLLHRARAAQDELALVTEALRRLLRDENFVNLLRAENLGAVPEPLVHRIRNGEEK